jgi:hypothetical protein
MEVGGNRNGLPDRRFGFKTQTYLEQTDSSGYWNALSAFSQCNLRF